MAHIVMVLKSDIRYDGRVRKEIRTLVEVGHRVELVVSDYDKRGAGGKDLGVKVHYIPMTIWPSASGNLLEQFSFNRTATSIIRQIKPSHIHCHDLTTLFAGVGAKDKVKARLVFDAHELKPERMNGIKRKTWNLIESRLINKCDYIIMPEKNRIAYFMQKYKNASNMSKVLLLQNFPRKSEIPIEDKDLFRKKYPINRAQKIVLYTGRIAPERYIEELIDSISICSNDFVLIILGRSSKEYEAVLCEQIQQRGLANRVFLHDPVPHAEIMQYMAACDIGTAFYRNTGLNSFYCASNKLYEYIALGKAVVTNNYPGLLETVEHFRQGVCLADITPRDLAESYIRASDPAYVTPGARKFFWEDEQDVLTQLYEK